MQLKKPYMKTTIVLTGVSLALSFSVQAQSTIADWTFETSAPATAGPISPETGSGAMTGSHAGATVYSSPAGNGSAHSYSSTLWANGDYYEAQVATTGYTDDISLSWSQTSSGTGPGQYQLQYSTDGSTWNNIGSTYTVLDNGLAPNASWNATTASSAYNFSVDLTAATSGAVDNDPTLDLRFEDESTTSASGGVVSTGGTDRIDNVLVQATAVPEPSSLSLFGVGGAIGLCFLRHWKK
jgi:hypothetical protein